MTNHQEDVIKTLIEALKPFAKAHKITSNPKAKQFYGPTISYDELVAPIDFEAAYDVLRCIGAI